MTGPLAGLHVVDLSTEISGGYCTKLLVDGGADVVKVEPPGGDPLRRWSATGDPTPDDVDAPLFRFLAAGKRSCVLDPARPADRAEIRALAATADLVVESFAPGAPDSRLLDLEVLQRENPGLCLISITPWGRSGPWADRPCTEFTQQAALGAIAYRGLPDRDPVACGGRLGEWVAGTFAAVGALSAWLSARRSGRGQRVDLSRFEAMALALTIYHDLNGQWHPGPLPRAIEIPSIEPARDGWVGFCTITGQQWKDFCVLIGHPEIGDDDQYLDGRRRMEHLDRMRAAIHGWTRERSVDEIVELASLMRIPVAAVGDGRTVLGMDHFVERGVFVRGDDGLVRPRVPYRIGSGGAPRPFGPSPGLGEHTDEIRVELNASRDRAKSRPEAEGGSALPFEGLRVVDLSAFWAGPFATCYLADLGADVVKVESIQRPDGMRFAGAVRNARLWEWSPVFHGANPGKRGLTLDLDSAEGMALLKKLLARADVVIENFSPRVLENFGLGWDTVHALNPRTVMVRMPAFGLDGPWRDRTGFAMTLEQVSGMAWVTGYEDLPLVVRGAVDPIGGMHAVFALMAALEKRRSTGEGELVEVPLVEVALNVAAEQVLEYSAHGRLLQRQENRGPVAAPQGVYRCANPDDYVAVAVASDAQWAALRRVLHDPAWARGADLERAAGRRARHDEIDERLAAWTGERLRDEVVGLLLAAGVPAAAVINAHDLHPNPQLEHRRFFQTLRHPETGETRYPGFPMGFSGLGTRLHRSPPPTLGQHNAEILEELGVDEAGREKLREARVIGTRPTFM